MVNSFAIDATTLTIPAGAENKRSDCIIFKTRPCAELFFNNAVFKSAVWHSTLMYFPSFPEVRALYARFNHAAVDESLQIDVLPRISNIETPYFYAYPEILEQKCSWTSTRSTINLRINLQQEILASPVVRHLKHTPPVEWLSKLAKDVFTRIHLLPEHQSRSRRYEKNRSMGILSSRTTRAPSTGKRRSADGKAKV